MRKQMQTDSAWITKRTDRRLQRLLQIGFDVESTAQGRLLRDNYPKAARPAGRDQVDG